MKAFILAVTLLCAPICYAEPSPCLIVKHASGFSAFANNANWEYVAGEFPKGTKWKGHLTDRNIRKIKELGGKVVTLQQSYKAEDLAQAEKACQAQ